MQKPEIINELEEKLLNLLQEDNSPSISIPKVAEVLGMDADCLRESIAQGRCPFGVGGKNQHGNRFGKIPKLALYNWMKKTG